MSHREVWWILTDVSGMLTAFNIRTTKEVVGSSESCANIYYTKQCSNPEHNRLIRPNKLNCFIVKMYERRKRASIYQECRKRNIIPKKKKETGTSVLLCGCFKNPPLNSTALLFSGGPITPAGLVPDVKLKG
jgi:hypothetical protein